MRRHEFLLFNHKMNIFYVPNAKVTRVACGWLRRPSVCRAPFPASFAAQSSRPPPLERTKKDFERREILEKFIKIHIMYRVRNSSFENKGKVARGELLSIREGAVKHVAGAFANPGPALLALAPVLRSNGAGNWVVGSLAHGLELHCVDK